MAKVLVLGDSITWGYPYGPSYSWVGILNREFNDIFINSGINGQTLEDIYARIEREILEYNPDLIILTCGINDAFIELSIDEIYFYINKIVEVVLTKNIKLIFGIPFNIVDYPYVDKKLRKIQDIIIETCSRYGLDYIDFRDNISLFDECHPNKDGYKAMAEIAKKKLLSLSYVKKILF